LGDFNDGVGRSHRGGHQERACRGAVFSVATLQEWAVSL
jgi:hypothetical protein